MTEFSNRRLEKYIRATGNNFTTSMTLKIPSNM
jgi:hypothetical protein